MFSNAIVYQNHYGEVILAKTSSTEFVSQFTGGLF